MSMDTLTRILGQATNSSTAESRGLSMLLSTASRTKDKKLKEYVLDFPDLFYAPKKKKFYVH